MLHKVLPQAAVVAEGQGVLALVQLKVEASRASAVHGCYVWNAILRGLFSVHVGLCCHRRSLHVSVTPEQGTHGCTSAARLSLLGNFLVEQSGLSEGQGDELGSQQMQLLSKL